MRLGNIGLIALVGAVLGACASNPIKETEGREVYTQRNMWVDGDRHLTTNYRAGFLVPAGTHVRILGTSSDKIELSTEEDITFHIVNVEGYSGQDIAGIYERYFAPQPPDLSRFSSAERAAIEAGEVKTGMSKAAVLVARGYPPSHQTPSLDLDRWRFWVNRFKTRVVRFDGDRVAGIEN